MAQDHSFDIVSKVNLQEWRNALAQAQKEIATRFDLKGSSASLAFEEASGKLKATADHSMQLNSVVDLLQTKMAKRGVSPLAFTWKPLETLPSGMKTKRFFTQWVGRRAIRKSPRGFFTVLLLYQR